VFLSIDNVLTAVELAELSAALAGGRFEVGRTTAGWNARLVKNNLQLEPKSDKANALREMVTNALFRNGPFNLAVRPKLMRPVMFTRYEPGMEYGLHVDDPMMGGPPAMRSDVSFTLFLSAPADYDGGELIIHTHGQNLSFKPPAGSLVLYPSTTMHRVAPITRGVRLAAVSWVQSIVRDAEQREILYDLDMARRENFDAHGKTREFDLMTKAFANLLRRWGEP
jgi:PKHD-type hydroxylase